MFKKQFAHDLKHDPTNMLKAVKDGPAFFDKADLNKIITEVDTCPSNKLNSTVLRLILATLATEFDPSDPDSLKPGAISRRLRARFPNALKTAKKRRNTFDMLRSQSVKCADAIHASYEKEMSRISRRIFQLEQQCEALRAKKNRVKQEGDKRFVLSSDRFKKAADRYDRFSYHKLTMGHGYAVWAAAERAKKPKTAKKAKAKRAIRGSA